MGKVDNRARPMPRQLEPTLPDILPYYEFVKKKQIIELRDEIATVGRDFLTDLMAPMLRRIRFDAEFYRKNYPDLAEAEERGLIFDLHQHYVMFGFFENRMPCLVEVDGAFYAREYPDVAIAILENRVASAQVHFETSGFVEGRLPRRGWSFAHLIEA